MTSTPMHRLAIAAVIVGCLAMAFAIVAALAPPPASWPWVVRYRKWRWRS